MLPNKKINRNANSEAVCSLAEKGMARNLRT